MKAHPCTSCTPFLYYYVIPIIYLDVDLQIPSIRCHRIDRNRIFQDSLNVYVVILESWLQGMSLDAFHPSYLSNLPQPYLFILPTKFNPRDFNLV